MSRSDSSRVDEVNRGPAGPFASYLQALEPTASLERHWFVAARVVMVESFEAFFAHDHDRMVARLSRRLGDADLANEAVAEAISRAWKRHDAGEQFDCLAAWIQTVAMNVARDALRRRATYDRITQPSVAHAEPSTSDDPVSALEFERHLACLAPRQRDVARLRYFDDLSHEEIGDRLGISTATVKNILRRVRCVLIGSVSLVLVFVLVVVLSLGDRHSPRVEIDPPDSGPAVPDDNKRPVTPDDIKVNVDESPAPSRTFGPEATNPVTTPGRERTVSTSRTRTTGGLPTTGAHPTNGGQPATDTLPTPPTTTSPTTPPTSPPTTTPSPPPPSPPTRQRLTATQTDNGFSYDTTGVTYGDFDLTFIEARTNPTPVKLHFLSPAGITLKIAPGETRTLRLGIGGYILCAYHCAQFLVTPQNLGPATEAADVVTLVVGEAGDLRAPHREIGTDVPQGFGLITQPNTNGRWMNRPAGAYRFEIRGASDSTRSWSVWVGSEKVTVAPNQLVTVSMASSATSGLSAPPTTVRVEDSKVNPRVVLV